MAKKMSPGDSEKERSSLSRETYRGQGPTEMAGDSRRNPSKKSSSRRRGRDRRQLADEWPVDDELDQDVLSDEVWEVFCDDGDADCRPEVTDYWREDDFGEES